MGNDGDDHSQASEEHKEGGEIEEAVGEGNDSGAVNEEESSAQTTGSFTQEVNPTQITGNFTLSSTTLCTLHANANMCTIPLATSVHVRHLSKEQRRRQQIMPVETRVTIYSGQTRSRHRAPLLGLRPRGWDRMRLDPTRSARGAGTSRP